MNTLRNTTQDAASEYIPQPNESNGNGNDHGKIFTLKPALDPDTIAILEARRTALTDQRLIRSMKAFFCHILDASLDPAFYYPHPRGVVTLSDPINAETFGVSPRTIYTWKKRIEAVGYFWLSEQYRKNMWPITTYHLSCLHRPPRGRTDESGTYGTSGSGRSRPQNPGLGGRQPGQLGLTLPGSRQKAKSAENAQVLETAGLSRNGLPVSPEADFRSEPKQTSGESRSRLPVRAEADFRSEPKQTSGESRSVLPVRPEADFRHIESENEKGEGTETSLKRSTLVNAQEAGREWEGTGHVESASLVASLLKGLKVKEPPKPKSTEGIFLLDVGAMMETWRKGSSKAELANSGAWWRLAFRADRDLIQRVLAETLRAVKERQVKETPGQYAADLWKRWGGKLP
jgi:hypothetical protein